MNLCTLLPAAVLLVLFNDEMVGHPGDIVADHARQRSCSAFSS